MPPSHVNAAPPHLPRHRGAHTSQTPSLPFRDHVAAGAPSPRLRARCPPLRVPSCALPTSFPCRSLTHALPVPAPATMRTPRPARPRSAPPLTLTPRVHTAAAPSSRALSHPSRPAAPLRPLACPSRPTSTPPSRLPPVRCYAHPVLPPPVPTSAPPPPCRHARSSPHPSHGRVPLLRPYSRPPPRRHASLLHNCATAHPPVSRPHLATAPSARTLPHVDTAMRCDHTESASLSGSLPIPTAQSRLRAPEPTSHHLCYPVSPTRLPAPTYASRSHARRVPCASPPPLPHPAPPLHRAMFAPARAHAQMSPLLSASSCAHTAVSP
jgi:hypothetical protein